MKFNEYLIILPHSIKNNILVIQKGGILDFYGWNDPLVVLIIRIVIVKTHSLCFVNLLITNDTLIYFTLIKLFSLIVVH